MQGQRQKPSVTGMIHFDCSDSARLHKQIEFELALILDFDKQRLEERPTQAGEMG